MMTSVAMATYNGEKYIIEQLESIRTQKLPVDEVVICDDGSSDATVEMIEGYIKDHRLVGWSIEKNNENLGFIKNFRKALSKTTGEYVFLCDQDDVWENNKTEIMLGIMQKNNIQVLNTSFSPIDGEGEFIPISKEQRHNNCNLLPCTIDENVQKTFDIDTIVYKNLSPGCTMCIRRDILDKYMESDIVNVAHDWTLNIIGSLNNGAVFLNTPLIRYRLHGNNTIGLGIGQQKREKNNTSQKPKALSEIYEERVKYISFRQGEIINNIDAVETFGGSYDRKLYRRMTRFFELWQSFYKKPDLATMFRLALRYDCYKRIKRAEDLKRDMKVAVRQTMYNMHLKKR